MYKGVHRVGVKFEDSVNFLIDMSVFCIAAIIMDCNCMITWVQMPSTKQDCCALAC